MNIEKFYYDEQTEMYELMKKEQDEHEQSLSVEKGKRTSKIIPGSKNNYGKSRA